MCGCIWPKRRHLLHESHSGRRYFPTTLPAITFDFMHSRLATTHLTAAIVVAIATLCPLAVPISTAAAQATGNSRAAVESDAIRWADSVLTTMTLRDRAAQMVWPNIYADYVPADAKSWRKVTSYVADQKVGGILMSI